MSQEIKIARSTIICSYILCFLIPLAGLGSGLYLFAKSEKFHGSLCIIISFFFMLALAVIFLG